MRIISLLLLSLSLYCYSGASSAADFYWTQLNYTQRFASPSAVCHYYRSYVGECQYTACNNESSANNTHIAIKTSETQFRCEYYSQPSGFKYGSLIAIRNGDSCPTGQVYNSSNGTCAAPTCPAGQTWNGTSCETDNQCAAKAGQSTNWRAEYDSMSAYDSNPIRCTTSQGGCAVDVCDSGSHTCQVDGRTGKFVCTGQGGKYTGQPNSPSNGTGVDGCEGPACQPSPPQTSSSDKSCTTPAVASGVTSYTCVTESNSNQFADSNCAVGDLNGVTALHCTSPDYVPESNDKTKTDDVSQTSNPDGGKTTTTESTVDQTKCKAGDCSSTSTTTTTETTTDGSGEVTGENSQCTGDRCDDPSTPQDESEEEEKEEEPKREVTGQDCSSGLSCVGDAIDCAVLRQLKEQRCSMDWETNKSAVLAEAGKSEYQLGTDEIDAADLFSGPSAGRWLSPTCPADRVIHLATTGTSITFSWSFVCQYASGLGNLLVALASLFFAVYVGRAFGGD